MLIEEDVKIESGGLQLEGVLSYRQDCRGRGGALICPPHPLLGGDMNNNVIEALARTLAEDDLVSLRFNYRGVGQSQADGGAPPPEENLAAFWDESIDQEDPRKVDDALAALELLRKVLVGEDVRLTLVGYSFGAFVASEVARRASKVSALVLLSPPIHQNDFDSLSSSRTSKMIVVSDDDFVYPLCQVEEFFHSLSPPKDLRVFKGGNHFFLGQELDVARSVKEYLNASCFDFRAWT